MKYFYKFRIGVILFFFVLIIAGCKNDSVSPTSSSFKIEYLVGDTLEYPGERIDGNLLNAWGLAIGPTGNFWISSNHKGETVVYDKNGVQKSSPYIIPAVDPSQMGSPTGQIYNSTADFVIPSTSSAAKFLFAAEDGSISAWASGDSAKIVVDRSATGAVYKGIALANDGSANFIYSADFKGKKIDVFDKNFALVTNKPFIDPNIPSDFGPFGITNIGGKLYVAYAKPKAPDFMDDESGPGNGFVDIYNPDGTLVQRFITQGKLNSPWGIVKAPSGFGPYANAILVANFGDGRILAYDVNGSYLGTVSDKDDSPIIISGLWAISFLNNSSLGDVNTLYFTAGPDEENHGLFGYIQVK